MGVGDETLETFLKSLPQTYDKLLAQNISYTSGGWGSTPSSWLPLEDAKCVGWFGIGGSILLDCTIGSYKATISYVMNAMSPVLKVDNGLILLEELISLLLSSREGD